MCPGVGATAASLLPADVCSPARKPSLPSCSLRTTHLRGPQNPGALSPEDSVRLWAWPQQHFPEAPAPPLHTHRRGWSGSTALDWQGWVSRHNPRAHRCPWHSTCPAHIRWKGIKKPSETSDGPTTAQEKGREGEQSALHVTVSCPRGARLDTQVGLGRHRASLCQTTVWAGTALSPLHTAGWLPTLSRPTSFPRMARRAAPHQ